MLVLTRRENETLVIDDEIKLTVLSIKGGQVRLGIDAPKSVSIQRSELLEESVAQNNECISSANG